MIKWNLRAVRVALALGALASFVLAAGASLKWS